MDKDEDQKDEVLDGDIPELLDDDGAVDPDIEEEDEFDSDMFSEDEAA